MQLTINPLHIVCYKGISSLANLYNSVFILESSIASPMIIRKMYYFLKSIMSFCSVYDVGLVGIHKHKVVCLADV